MTKMETPDSTSSFSTATAVYTDIIAESFESSTSKYPGLIFNPDLT